MELMNYHKPMDIHIERVAREAARLRYEEPELYREYYHAKREAARRLNVSVIPSNKDIFIFYQEIANMREGKDDRAKRLIEMREEALYWMQKFKDFKPRLLGSVRRGDVTSKSDIDMHVLVQEEYDEFLQFLSERCIQYDCEVKVVRDPDEGVKEYHHVYLLRNFKTEITIYLEDEYSPQICSIFGERIRGLTVKQVAKLVDGDKNGLA